MTDVIALSSFDHGGNRRRGSRFSVSERAAKELARAGLVRIVEQHPATPDGAKLSASPAGPASPQTTVKKSGRGGKAAATADPEPQVDQIEPVEPVTEPLL